MSQAPFVDTVARGVAEPNVSLLVTVARELDEPSALFLATVARGVAEPNASLLGTVSLESFLDYLGVMLEVI